jgi:hypothetical protein
VQHGRLLAATVFGHCLCVDVPCFSSAAPVAVTRGSDSGFSTTAIERLLYTTPPTFGHEDTARRHDTTQRIGQTPRLGKAGY